MYAAKEGGRGHLLFEPQLDRYSPRRLSLAGALRSAIADGEIVLYFQPKAELTTGKIIGVEALARWQHPRLGLIGPSEFVPIAEQTGLIGPLTSHVLEEALRQVREWSDNGEELQRRRQPVRPLVPGRPARRRDPEAARAHRRRGPPARARDHREHADARSRPARRRRSTA